ncbi:MAG: pyruvate formate lyase family protein [Smithella sp.]|nr:pyruvate formate lyase family protein [Smithella sp.]
MAEAAVNIKELEKNQEWWRVAEQKRSKRLDYLRKAVWKKGAVGGLYAPGIKVDLERAGLFTEGYFANLNDPGMVRHAKAVANVLDNIPIFITDQAQLVGYVGSAPHTISWLIEGGSLLNEEVYNEPGIAPEPEAESLKKMAAMMDKWNGYSVQDRFIPYVLSFAAEEGVKLLSGAVGWGLPISISGYNGKDYEYILTAKRGFEDIIAEIDRRQEDMKDKARKKAGPEYLHVGSRMMNWEGMKIALQAVIRYANRYARLAKIVAENYETDPKRREELLRIAETCERVPAKPQRNLQESLQFDHFLQVVERFESGGGAWPSRPDYYHGSWYDKDVNIDKRLTKEEALDLVGEFMIRAHEVGSFFPRWTREGLQGITGTWVWTLGGVKQDGADACNDLTVAFLQAARLVRVSNPTFAFRWHPQVKDEVMRECFECIRQGLGYPSMRNDPVLITNVMHWHGHPIEEARTWVHQACMSPCPTTKHGFQPMRMASATANMAKVVEYALFNGYDPIVNMQMGPQTGDARKFKSFDELYNAWAEQLKWLMNLLTMSVNFGRVMSPEMCPRSFLSSISERCVESGQDAASPEGDRGNSWITAFTWVENIDSLAAVKKLVFDDKKYTMDQLITALEANWEGFEQMRLDFVKNAPKWGNDDDYVDDIMLKCLREAAAFSRVIKDPSGNNWPILPENVSGNIHYANIVRALPNGRRLGDALYDGGISPGPGLDKKGPTAVLKSCGKINHITDGRAFLLNQRLSPTQLSGEKGYQLWRSYMHTWADLGLDHIQFNVIDDATLRSAQREPEKYQEVIVRVAGYSAHFVDISRKTQDNIIQRTVQGIG